MLVHSACALGCSIEDVLASMLEVGQVIGLQGESEHVVKQLQGRVNAAVHLASQLGGGAKAPKVCVA